MNILKEMLYRICSTFGDIHLTDCRVCHRVYFSGKKTFNCCPGDHNNWGFGRRPTKKGEYRTFTCPICGKQYTSASDARSAEAYAAYSAFRCCPRPENDGLRNLSSSARTARSERSFMPQYLLAFSSKGIPYVSQYYADRSDNVYTATATASTRGQPCPDCRGTGRINGVHCDRCGGTGKLLV